MQNLVEKRLQRLIPSSENGPVSAREVLYRDVLLLQLAKQVGAPLHGIYDDDRQLRLEEITQRIRQATQNQPENRASGVRRSRHGFNLGFRSGWVWVSLILVPFGAIAIVSFVAIQLGLLPGL